MNSTGVLHQVTVVVAVEQPRPEIWRFFSHSILLKSGKSVYCGPADQALQQVARLVSLGLRCDFWGRVPAYRADSVVYFFSET